MRAQKENEGKGMRRSFRRLLPWLSFAAFCILLALVFLAVINAAVCHKTKDRILGMDELSTLEDIDVVIVLGCKVYDDGSMSARLEDRVRKGVEVLSLGVGETLLMSGDRRDDGSYDEVGAMREAAIGWGIDEERVLIDPDGNSTYESMVRLLEIYEGKRVVIVSQTYHLYRAIYIAQKLGIEAWGVGADARPYRDWLKCEVRELFARPKDVLYMQIRPSIDSVES